MDINIKCQFEIGDRVKAKGYPACGVVDSIHPRIFLSAREVFYRVLFDGCSPITMSEGRLVPATPKDS